MEAPTRDLRAFMAAHGPDGFRVEEVADAMAPEDALPGTATQRAPARAPDARGQPRGTSGDSVEVPGRVHRAESDTPGCSPGRPEGTPGPEALPRVAARFPDRRGTVRRAKPSPRTTPARSAPARRSRRCFTRRRASWCGRDTRSRRPTASPIAGGDIASLYPFFPGKEALGADLRRHSMPRGNAR